MLVVEFTAVLICAYMLGMGVGKIRWELEKFINRRK